MTDRFRRLVHPPADGACNMAVDEALMDVAHDGGVALRFYRWDPPCLSLGRNQRARGAYDPAAAEREGIDVVRRPTGGRAVFHRRELTYSVVAPAGSWGGLRESYRRINRALLRGLAGLGADVDEADRVPEGGTPGPSRRACFRDPLPGEIVARGRKLVGSAQWRHEGALLQHGSLLLHDDQSVVERLRTDAVEDAPAAAAASGVAGAPGSASADTGARGPARGGSAGASPGEASPSAEGGSPPTAAAASAGAGASGAVSSPSPGGAAAPGGRGEGAAASLADLLPELPGPDRLAEVLARAFAEEFGAEPVEAGLTPRQRARAARLEERYRSDEWTWRR